MSHPSLHLNSFSCNFSTGRTNTAGQPFKRQYMWVTESPPNVPWCQLCGTAGQPQHRLTVCCENWYPGLWENLGKLVEQLLNQTRAPLLSLFLCLTPFYFPIAVHPWCSKTSPYLVYCLYCLLLSTFTFIPRERHLYSGHVIIGKHSADVIRSQKIATSSQRVSLQHVLHMSKCSAKTFGTEQLTSVQQMLQVHVAIPAMDSILREFTLRSSPTLWNHCMAAAITCHIQLMPLVQSRACTVFFTGRLVGPTASRLVD